MTTVKVDDKQRVRIPEAKPGQVFALRTTANGFELSHVEAKTGEQWQLVKGCDCKGSSKPGVPLPCCAECGKSWKFEMVGL